MAKRFALVLDSDSAVYAQAFQGQKKTHYAIHNGKVVKTMNDKRDLNNWAKTQEDFPLEELEFDYTENLDPKHRVIDNTRAWIHNQMEFGGCERAILLLTKGGDCFRTRLATIQRYKGNRLNMVKPHYYKAVRDYMVKYYGAKVYHQIEADDMACILMNKGKSSKGEVYVLGAIDKDLNQIDGLRFNPNKNGKTYQTKEYEKMKAAGELPKGFRIEDVKEEGLYQNDPLEGWREFYLQMVLGDTADHIQGVPGIGPKHEIVAELKEADSPEEMDEIVQWAYRNKFGDAFELTPWWWQTKKGSDEWKYGEDELATRMRLHHRSKLEIVDWKYMYRENADLLYMLRTLDDQYRPHHPIDDWEEYDGGVVAAQYPEEE